MGNENRQVTIKKPVYRKLVDPAVKALEFITQNESQIAKLFPVEFKTIGNIKTEVEVLNGHPA
jgi:hypothetical protein